MNSSFPAIIPPRLAGTAYQQDEENYANAQKRIVENSTCRRKSPTYPTARKTHGKRGKQRGNRDEIIDGWRLSTDIGCAFISMDALAARRCLQIRACVRCCRK